MTKITTVTDNSKQALRVTAPVYQQALFDSYAAYVRRDLRKRFDDEESAWKAIGIIEETRELGFPDLADEMRKDFCIDDQPLWNAYEAGQKEEEKGERLFIRTYEIL